MLFCQMLRRDCHSRRCDHRNPFFAVNSALVSRFRLFEFQPLAVDDIVQLLRRALSDRHRGLGAHEVRFTMTPHYFWRKVPMVMHGELYRLLK